MTDTKRPLENLSLPYPDNKLQLIKCGAIFQIAL